MKSPTLLSVKQLRKSYSSDVLKNVDIDFHAQEIHALMGTNGAGKTTFSHILCGITKPDSGEMRYKGQIYQPSSVNDAKSLNIRIVTQELSLIDDLSIAENLFLDRFPQRNWLIDADKLNDQADELLLDFGLSGLDCRSSVKSLSIGQKQLIEIASVLSEPCDVLILDEPTATLSPTQVDLLFTKLRSLASAGCAIIYISHRIDEIFELCNRISVLRDGSLIHSAESKKLDALKLISLMSDKKNTSSSKNRSKPPSSLALQIKGLSSPPLLKDIHLDIYAGEILGLAGLMGAGRSELLRTLFGADSFQHGSITLGEDKQTVSFSSPFDAVRANVGMTSEDRKQTGLLTNLSIRENMSIASLNKLSNSFGWLKPAEESMSIETFVSSLNIECSSIEQNINQLSGGNQQKVMIARWLLAESSILFFDEPTRGVDIQTKSLIYDLLRSLAAQGMAIVFASSEMEELTETCDRIAVMSNGRISEVFSADAWAPEQITAACFSGFSDSSERLDA